MSPDTPTFRDDERGIALIAVLFAVVILLGLATVFVATATFESRSSSVSRDAEAALHVAEAASDDLIADINRDTDGFVTHDADGEPHEVPTGSTASEEREILLAYAEEAEVREDGEEGPRLVVLNEGVGFAIRPVDENGDVRDVIYTVGWVPDRATARRQKVLKLQFDNLRYRPDVGLLGGGDLTYGGNASVRGQFGDVHVNGDATGSSGSFDVDGRVSATGSCDFDAECGEDARRPVPEIRARDFYRMESQAAAEWYDLCPPGHPDAVATIRHHAGGGPPCSGEVRWSNPSHSQVGWRWSQGHQEWTSTGSHDGVFYVYRSNARITGTQGDPTPVTIIAEADPNDDGNSSGHIHVGGGGSTSMESALSGISLITDRDIRLRGGTMEGLVAAHEQIHVPGNPIINGAVIAEDAVDTPGSWVRRSTNGGAVKIEGTMTINYDEQLDVPLSGVIRITAWNELR